MATATATKVGKVIQVIGPVIDVEFEGGYLPSIYNALKIVATLPTGEKVDIVTEVEQHLGEGRVRTVAMKPTDGMRRGMDAIDTGAPISMPVGSATRNAKEMVDRLTLYMNKVRQAAITREIIEVVSGAQAT